MKIGLIGLGHLGTIHLKCLTQIEEWKIGGIYDLNEERAKELSKEYNVPYFKSVDELLDEVDAVDIVTSTDAHYKIARQALENNRHAFIEKPVCSTSAEAKELKKILLAKENLKLQIGHVERFNPAFASLDGEVLDPQFMEIHRLAMFNPRGNEVSVVHDLMIHDLDIVLYMIKSPVREVRANGVNVVSDTADICNARIEFENDAVVNITASRISLKNMRKMRLFQPDKYISVDFLEKKTEIISLSDQKDESKNQVEIDIASGTKYIEMKEPEIEPVNAILEELKSFYYSIINNEKPIVDIEDGIKALELVEQIDNQSIRQAIL